MSPVQATFTVRSVNVMVEDAYHADAVPFEFVPRKRRLPCVPPKVISVPATTDAHSPSFTEYSSPEMV